MSKEEKKMESVLTENRIFDPVKLCPEYAKTGMSMDEYKKLYKQSIEDMEGFWGEPVSYTHLTLPTTPYV